MVFGCLDYALNWTSQILGWFGIGRGGAQQQVQQQQAPGTSL